MVLCDRQATKYGGKRAGSNGEVILRRALREKEKEIMSKIKVYKEQGLPKVAISSKLGISGRMLNKYYFQIE